MENINVKRVPLMPKRLDFSDSDDSPNHNVVKTQDSPKTPPNHIPHNPPMTPINRKNRPVIPIRFAEHLATPAKADSSQKEHFINSSPIQQIRLLKLKEQLLNRRLQYLEIHEPNSSSRLSNKTTLYKSKQFSINPFSPANNNNNSTIESWTKDLTNVKLSDLQIPRYFKEFNVERIIGKGDFGEVYKCINILDGMPYAIKKTLQKVIGTKRENYARKEVYANAALYNHPNIVAYHSAWNESNSVFIQLEYCDGGNLDEMIFAKRHNFNVAAVERLLSHLASGIHYIHKSKLVHLDIKPANIMISHSVFLKEDENKVDKDIIYKIGDLGHVAHIDNLSDVEKGDSRYLPKEMLSGKYDSSTIMKVDVFSLGMTVYEAVSASRLPSDGPEWHLLRDGFIPKINGSGLSLLLANMIDPNPINRPSAIDVYKNVTLNTTEQAVFSTLHFKRECLTNCTKTRSTQCSTTRRINNISRRVPMNLMELHRRRLSGQKFQSCYSL